MPLIAPRTYCTAERCPASSKNSSCIASPPSRSASTMSTSGTISYGPPVCPPIPLALAKAVVAITASRTNSILFSRDFNSESVNSRLALNSKFTKLSKLNGKTIKLHLERVLKRSVLICF